MYLNSFSSNIKDCSQFSLQSFGKVWSEFLFFQCWYRHSILPLWQHRTVCKFYSCSLYKRGVSALWISKSNKDVFTSNHDRLISSTTAGSSCILWASLMHYLNSEVNLNIFVLRHNEYILSLIFSGGVFCVELTQPPLMVLKSQESLSISASSYWIHWISQTTGKALEWVGYLCNGGSTNIKNSLKNKISFTQDTSKNTVFLQEN